MYDYAIKTKRGFYYGQDLNKGKSSDLFTNRVADMYLFKDKETAQNFADRRQWDKTFAEVIAVEYVEEGKKPKKWFYIGEE